jgi:putative inorganic carbon (hco3(-)) transporter
MVLFNFSRGKKFIFNKLYLILIILLFVSIVSLISSDNVSIAARNEITLLSSMFLVFLFINICRSDLIYKRIIFWIFRVAIIISIIAIFQNIYWMFTGEVIIGRYYSGWYPFFGGIYVFKSSAFFTGGLVLGHYLLLPIILGIQLWPYIKKRKHKILIKTSVILSIIALFLTFSRAAWVSFLLYVFYIFIKKIGKLAKVIRYPIVIMNLLFITISVVPTITFFVNTLSPISTYNRLGIINSSIQSIYQNPYFGKGLGTTVGQAFSYEQYERISSDVANRRDIGGPKTLDIDLGKSSGRETHNTFLQVAVDLGLIGLFLYLFLLYAVWKNRMVSIQKSNDNILDAMKKGVSYAFVFSAICSIFSSILLVKQNWILISLVVAGSSMNHMPSIKNIQSYYIHKLKLNSNV